MVVAPKDEIPGGPAGGGARRAPVAKSHNREATKLRNFLWSQGFAITNEEGNWTTFNFEGGKYFIEVSDTDAEYLRLIYPRFYICPFEKRLPAISAANQMNILAKIAKITYEEKDGKIPGEIDVTFHIIFEIFLSLQSEDFNVKFARYLRMIRVTRDAFMDLLK